jgi:RimJ/RimL family protein N-acetyltransferase
LPPVPHSLHNRYIATMGTESFILSGRHVRLEPLNRSHIAGLAAAASTDDALYRWTSVPRNEVEAATYIEAALAMQDAGDAVPFAIVRVEDGAVIGSTRFWNLERWPWPRDHLRRDGPGLDACEIGHTWLAASAIRTAANTEAKLLMLMHAFETWQVLRVCLHTDARNQRSRTAIERIGATFEGLLRAHRMAADHTPRDSARFSIVAAEWPAVKQHLHGFLNRTSS